MDTENDEGDGSDTESTPSTQQFTIAEAIADELWYDQALSYYDMVRRINRVLAGEQP